jgi:hypothetical protein
MSHAVTEVAVVALFSLERRFLIGVLGQDAPDAVPHLRN